MKLVTILWPYISHYPYLLLFAGMLAGGETFLLPAVYLAINGAISFNMVVLLSCLATLISDSAWYAIGRSSSIAKTAIWKKLFKDEAAKAALAHIFEKHRRKLLYASKFVYGTRTLAQVLSGVVRMPFLEYSIINLAGILSYLLFISLLAIFTREGLASWDMMPYNGYVSVIFFIIIVGILHICLKKWLGKNFIAPSSPPGTKSGQ